MAHSIVKRNMWNSIVKNAIRAKSATQKKLDKLANNSVEPSAPKTYNNQFSEDSWCSPSLSSFSTQIASEQTCCSSQIASEQTCCSSQIVDAFRINAKNTRHLSFFNRYKMMMGYPDIVEKKQTMKESVEEYMEKMLIYSDINYSETIATDSIETRVRRKLQEGSYSNSSVEEKKLPTLLR